MLTHAAIDRHLGPAGRRRTAGGGWYLGMVWVPSPGVAVWLAEGKVEVRREAAGAVSELVGVPTTIGELDELVARASR